MPASQPCFARFTAVLSVLLATATLGLAIPAPTVPALSSGVTPLSAADISAFRPLTSFASAAYCDPKVIRTWTCGKTCDANPGFKPVAAGGDGVITQFWFVGYDPALDEVIVSHQGTDVDAIIPVLTDLDFLLVPLDPFKFPGVPPLALVHMGFAGTQSRSAGDVLTAVKTALAQFKTTKVAVTGHSLGAAIALLDSVYLPHHLPAGTAVRYVGYGQPRVGNKLFADYVDGLRTSVTRIVNKRDTIVALPPPELLFWHTSGEVHIDYPSGEWVACAGQENRGAECFDGDVPTFLLGNETDHSGPYDGIEMGC